MEEDDATGGGDGAGGSGGGGGLEGWPDDDGEEYTLRRPPVTNRVGASSSTASTAPGGAPKRRAGTQLQGGQPKKPKGTAAATRREEAAAKAAQFQRAPKQPPTVAPLSLKRSASTSVIGGTEGFANTRRIDPLADLWETEKNAREDYHNILAAAFNSQVQELAKRTTDLADSWRANATLRQQLGEAQTALHAKEEERSKMEKERDSRAKQLADQAD
nr:uncharacterized protein LOC109759857 [Aegilops tauschii subsp. strangulata]